MRSDPQPSTRLLLGLLATVATVARRRATGFAHSASARAALRLFNRPTRHRCNVARSTLVTAALSPSCTSAITSLTPRSPRRVKERRKSGQNVSASDADCYAKDLAPVIAVDADRDGHRNRDGPAAARTTASRTFT